MDIRDFASDDPPDLPRFVNPGIAPPSFIYSEGQVRPPYDLDVDSLEPFPACDANYASICSIQHAIQMVTKARLQACPLIELGGDNRTLALASISAGSITAPYTSGFGVFVMSEDGTILADGLVPYFVGSRLDGTLASGFLPQPGLLDYITWVTDWGGGFVPHYTTRLDTSISVVSGDAPVSASAYFERCETGERIGVAFGREPLTPIEDCDGSTNAFCSIHNMRYVMGRATVDFLNSHSAIQLREIFFQMSYGTDYNVGDHFYLAALQMNWWGYPGPDLYRNPGVLPDTKGTSFAFGATLATAAVGYNATFWYPDTDAAIWMTVNSNRAAWQGGRWQKYDLPIYGVTIPTVTFSVGVMWNETAYQFGNGMEHHPQDALTGPKCQECSSYYSYACSLLNTLRLGSHALTEMLTPNGAWSRISNSSWFGSMWENSTESEYDDTWPSNLTVFAFSFSGECVADGRYPENVGQAAAHLLGTELHERFKVAANTNMGKAFLAYKNPSANETLLAQVTKVVKGGVHHYMGIAVRKAWAPWDDQCNSTYSSPCSEANAEALVGAAFADIMASEDASSLAETLEKVTGGLEEYSEEFRGDFTVQVLTTELECPDGAICPEDYSEQWMSPILETTPDTASWVELTEVDSNAARHAFVARITWASPVEVTSQDLFIFVLVGTDTAPQRCDAGTSCPGNSTCVDNYCECNSGWRAKYDEDSSSCGELKSAEMTCVDVRYQLCSGDDGLTCVPCPAGYNCPDGDASICQAGFYCPEASPLKLCPRGYLGNSTGATSLSDCYQCAPGTMSESEGQTACEKCEAGTSVDTSGASACERCAEKTYQDETGKTSCLSCPDGMTTLYRGATAQSECVCPSGTYLPLSGWPCLPCPDGMSCGEENSTEAAIVPVTSGRRLSNDTDDDTTETQQPFPTAAEGYAVLVDDPLSPYRCKDKSWCPGGAPGSCATNRDPYSIGCAKCAPNTFSTSDGTCEKCDDHTGVVSVVVAIILALICLGSFSMMVGRNQINQTSATTVMVISFSLGLSAIQTLNIFSNLDLRWVNPLEGIMEAFTFFSFDLTILRLNCLVSDAAVRNHVFRQSIAPTSAILIAISIFIKKKFWNPNIDYAIDVCNAVGACFQLFFVSILLSALTPFVCYKHPNNLGYSMFSDPAVLCDEKGDYVWLMGVAVGTILVVVVPYIGVMLYATVGYRSASCNSDAALRHLRRFRFLFVRYTPQCYWYGLATLARGTLVCLVPVVARDSPVVQVLSMSMFLLGFCLLQMNFKPWRGYLPNLLDAVVSKLLVLLVICVAMTTDFDGDDSVLGTVGAIVLFALLLGVSVLLLHSLIKHLRPTPFYAKFVCHHKADAAAQARLLQILFARRTKARCFIDSDHLTNLEELFDIVRNSCGRLVVYLTAETLRRPWCAGEVTVAYKVHQRVTSIITSSFVPPTFDEINHIQTYIAEADFKLVEYHIEDEHISEAFRWLLGNLSDDLRMSDVLVGRARFEAIVDRVIKHHPDDLSRMATIATATSERSSTSVAMSSRATEMIGRDSVDGSKIRPSSFIISSLPGDDEGTAAAAILAGRIQAQIVELVPAGIVLLADSVEPNSQEVLAGVANAHIVAVILSSGSLESMEQLQVILVAMGAEVPCLPVNTPNFRFPGAGFFQKSLAHKFDQADVLELRFLSFFKLISVALTTYASLQVLDVQAEAIVQRIPSKAHRANGGKKNQDVTVLKSETTPQGLNSSADPQGVEEKDAKTTPATDLESELGGDISERLAVTRRMIV